MGVRRAAALAAAAQLVLLAICSNASASVACPADLTQPTVDNAPEAATALACDINVMRTQRGLRPLRWDWRLWTGAQRQADDMAARHYASHVTPEGLGVADRMVPTGYIPARASWSLAENLGWGTSYFSTPLAIVYAWMDSDHHRENVLDPQLEDIGVGMQIGSISEGGQSGAIFVADFGTRGKPVDTLRLRGRARRSRRR
jgi:uncharacterized protein YkwD